MELVDRTGTFKFAIVEHGVSETRNGFPQFVARLQALEYYDSTGEMTEDGEPGWVDWAEYEQFTTLYTVLFNNDGPLLNYEQLQKALNWDGGSFADLTDGFEDTIIQGRVEENTYKDKTSLRVEWIDAEDADPNSRGGIKTIDANEIKNLDTKFGQFMKSGKKAATPAKAKTKATPKAKSKPGKKSAPTTPSKKKSSKKSSTSSTTVSSKDEAWEAAYTNKPNEVDDDTLAGAFLEAIENTGDESDFDASDWNAVYEATMENLTANA